MAQSARDHRRPAPWPLGESSESRRRPHGLGSCSRGRCSSSSATVADHRAGQHVDLRRRRGSRPASATAVPHAWRTQASTRRCRTRGPLAPRSCSTIQSTSAAEPSKPTYSRPTLPSSTGPNTGLSPRGRPANSSMATGRAGEPNQSGQQSFGQVEIGHVAGHQRRRLGHRPDHQRHLRDDAQRAQRAGHQAAHVVAGGVFDHAAAAGKRRARAIHGREAQQIVAHRAVGISSRAGRIDGHRAADGRPVGLRNVDRQPLPLGRQSICVSSAIVMPASTVIVRSSAG